MSEEELLGKRVRVLALLDAYGPLLSPAQDKALTGYYRYDLSLTEMAEEEGVSRSGVYDAIKKGIAKLEGFEAKLGLVAFKGKVASMLDEAKAEPDPKKKEKIYERLRKEIEHGI